MTEQELFDTYVKFEYQGEYEPCTDFTAIHGPDGYVSAGTIMMILEDEEVRRKYFWPKTYPNGGGGYYSENPCQ